MTYEPRKLDIITLDNAAAHYAREFRRGSIRNTSASPMRYWSGGHAFVIQEFCHFGYKDEFEFLHKRIRELLDPGDLTSFDQAAAQAFEPRNDDDFAELLLKNLAINPAGEHVPGAIGKVQIGKRRVGKTTKMVEVRGPKRWGGLRQGELREVRHFPKNVTWPVYAGEIEERDANPDGAEHLTPLPEGAETWPMLVAMATNPRISNELAIAMADQITLRLDEGSTAATIRGRSGAQPAGADETETGTLLFTLTMSDPAFPAAADGTPGGLATASAITDDSAADATGTLGYCRMGATGTGVDDHVDGEAGTSGADFNLNTLAIVQNAVVSISSLTMTVPES